MDWSKIIKSKRLRDSLRITRAKQFAFSDSLFMNPYNKGQINKYLADKIAELNLKRKNQVLDALLKQRYNNIGTAVKTIDSVYNVFK